MLSNYFVKQNRRYFKCDKVLKKLPISSNTITNVLKYTILNAPVTLLHDGDFLNDLLQIRLYRNLFDGNNLPRFLIIGLEYTTIRPADTKSPRFMMF